MRVLVYDGKHAPIIVFARTEEETDRAYQYLFNEFNSYGFYGYGDMCEVQEAWYREAKKGDIQAMKELLDYRCGQGFEYEGFEFSEVVTP